MPEAPLQPAQERERERDWVEAGFRRIAIVCYWFGQRFQARPRTAGTKRTEAGRPTWKASLSDLLFFFYDQGDSARQWFLCLLAWCQVAWELGGCGNDASVSPNPLEIPLFKAGSRSRRVPGALKEAIAQEAHGPDGPSSAAKVAQTLARFGKHGLRRLIPGRWSAMSAVRLQCLRYLHSARELFNERAEFLSVAFDGTRLGKKDVLQIALTSPDTGKAVFGPPQARGSIKGKGVDFSPPWVSENAFPDFRKMMFSSARKRNSTHPGDPRGKKIAPPSGSRAERK
jgi:hypothetical protein